jgi:hypothetical protein
MLSLALWLSGLAIEALLLLRAAQGKFLNRYKVFYVYIAWVLVQDSSLIPIYRFWPRAYAMAYWGGDIVAVLAGCALVWEVYRIAFSRYPGASRVARNVLLLVFIFAIGRILVEMWNSPTRTPGQTTLETELDLRSVQAAMLFGLIILFAYYAIPLGRNLRGIIFGYAFFLTTSVANLVLRDRLGDSFQHIWQYSSAVCYLLVLFVWGWTLWSYVPVPEPTVEPRLEADYEALLARTRAGFRSARSRLLKDMRP